MGIKRVVDIHDLQDIIQVGKILPTTDGASDTVYILDDKYILKIFENSHLNHLENEIHLLQLCNTLPVSKLVNNTIYSIQDKPALLYYKCDGQSITEVEEIHIKQIAFFLQQLHRTTSNVKSSNPQIFTKDYLQQLIVQTRYAPFQTIFNSLDDLSLSHDGIIHGDLFIDNALFENDTLSCVIDFSETCNGDFIFDLAVCAISWCTDEQEYQTLLDAYGSDLKLSVFKLYVKYALLYYSVTRYLNKRNYQELLERIECI
jgi:homoserine kinase type II